MPIESAFTSRTTRRVVSSCAARGERLGAAAAGRAGALRGAPRSDGGRAARARQLHRQPSICRGQARCGRRCEGCSRRRVVITPVKVEPTGVFRALVVAAAVAHLPLGAGHLHRACSGQARTSACAAARGSVGRSRAGCAPEAGHRAVRAAASACARSPPCRCGRQSRQRPRDACADTRADAHAHARAHLSTEASTIACWKSCVTSAALCAWVSDPSSCAASGGFTVRGGGSSRDARRRPDSRALS